MLAPVAAVLIALACARGTFSGVLGTWFDPPPVVLREAYKPNPSGVVFDHSDWDRVLKAHVKEGGWVDYAALAEDPIELKVLDRYIAAVGEARTDQIGRDGRLALLINAYNAFTVRLILDYWPIASIKDIPASKRWDDVRWVIGANRIAWLRSSMSRFAQSSASRAYTSCLFVPL